MIVVAAPRCGGTKFTYDLSIKHNLIFLGETRTNYIEGYTKYKQFKTFVHEHGQPMHSADVWIDSLHHPEKYAILANQLDIGMVLPKADYLLLRRNFNNIIASMIKFLGKGEDFYNIKFDDAAKAWEVRVVINNVYAMCLYSLKTGKKITWYEDHFNTPDYPITDELAKYVSIIGSTSLSDLFVTVGGLKPIY